jgi:hypothetical protein
MEELAIFRIFASFPLFGLLLPDLSTFFMYPDRGIPKGNIYVESFLLLSIIICSAGIWYSQKQDKSNNVKSNSGELITVSGK